MDLDAAFLQLIKDEEYAFSGSFPKMGRINDSIDLQFLRYKLRLQARAILYSYYAGAGEIDLTKSDFLEVQSLIKRRPELLGQSPVLNTFWRQIQFLQEDRNLVELSAAQHLMEYYDTYKSLFSLSEARDIVETMAGFSNNLTNRGRTEFSQFSFLMGLRVIELRFRGKKKVTADEYLSGATYANTGILGLNYLLNYDLSKLLDITDFGRRETINNLRDWLEAFADHYARYLDPVNRKMVRKFLRGGICFGYEEYVEVVKAFTNFSIPNFDPGNISIKRSLFCATYSVIYHGTAAERRMVRRRNLDLDVQIDRMRKHIEYLRETRPTMNKRLLVLFEEFTELKKLYALRRMVEKGTMSAKAKARYLRQKKQIDLSVFKVTNPTRRWLENELAALP